MSSTESGTVTGTNDKDYNLIAFTEMCLNGDIRLIESFPLGAPSPSNRRATVFNGGTDAFVDVQAICASI